MYCLIFRRMVAQAALIGGLGALLGLAACTPTPEQALPPGYDLAQVTSLPRALDEVSGLAVAPDGQLWAVQDEAGLLYRLGTEDKPLSLRFGPKGDYEDLAITSQWTAVLRSDGGLAVLPTTALATGELAEAQFHQGLVPPGEYEGLCAVGDSLGVLCKECPQADPRQMGRVYWLRLGPQGQLQPVGGTHLAVPPIARLAGEDRKFWFAPAALARHPRTGEWYVLSSVNGLLVVADAQWQPQAAYPLPTAQFAQPEGLAFDAQGNLYISNERDERARATLLRFAYQPSNKKTAQGLPARHDKTRPETWAYRSNHMGVSKLRPLGVLGFEFTSSLR
jgi:SdiA-regulated